MESCSHVVVCFRYSLGAGSVDLVDLSNWLAVTVASEGGRFITRKLIYSKDGNRKETCSNVMSTKPIGVNDGIKWC